MEKNTVELSLIADVVSDYFNLTVGEMLNNTRKKEIITARQWFQYLARDLNPLFIVSCDYIGSYLSEFTNIKYNHATILHSHKTIQGYIDVTKNDAKINNDLRERIQTDIDGQIYLNSLVPQNVNLLKLTQSHTHLKIN